MILIVSGKKITTTLDKNRNLSERLDKASLGHGLWYIQK